MHCIPSSPDTTQETLSKTTGCLATVFANSEGDEKYVSATHCLQGNVICLANS